MKTQMTVLALAATTLGVLAGCKPGVTTTSTGQPAATTLAARAAEPTLDLTLPATQPPTTPSASATTTKPATTKTTSPTRKPTPTKTTATPAGPQIVSFKLVQKPKCAEGTAVFRAPAVPAIIKWKITGATGAALSVDDPTNTPGTYGPEPLSGTETFEFGCAGPVGTVEKHTYAIWTVGGDGKQRSKTITATAKVLDNGKS
jgi:hypothetical protein